MKDEANLTVHVGSGSQITTNVEPKSKLEVIIGDAAKMDCQKAINYIKSGAAEIEQAVQEGIEDFNENAVSKTQDFNDNAVQKTNAFNQNAEQKQALVDEAAAEAKEWAIGSPEEPEEGSAKYWANEASSELATLESDVSAIQAVIPAQASSSNQLADKGFVNSSIATNTANFIGTFNSVAELEAYSGTLTNNDYAFVQTTDTAGNTLYDRYKWNGSEWLFEYELNNSSFTAAQWAAINSGATAEKLADYVTTNTAQTISGQKTFSSTPRRSSTIDLTATTGQTEVITLTTLDKGNQVFSSFNSCRSSKTNYVQQRITNKNLESTSNWFDIRANITDSGNGYANIACGSGVTNYNLTYATGSTSSTYIATMGWVNNPSASTNVVHRSGNETISGNKTFSQTSQPQVIRKNENQSMSGATSEVACTTSYRDGSNTVIATLGSYTASSSSGIYMRLGSWAGYDGITVRANWTTKESTTVINTDTTQVTTPTEDTTSSMQIDTVGARNTKLQDYATTAYVDSLVGAVHIVETGHNGTEWYRVWSDGFCEQGGTVGTGTTSGYPSYTIQLTKEYADTNFNVQVTGRYTSDTNNGTNYCSARTTSTITIRSVGYGSDWVTRGYIS